MHTNENTYDTFIPRWFGRLGNNIQQLSNGIYFCRDNRIHFTSPDHPAINSIDLNFGDNKFAISSNSHNWFYFFNGSDADFSTDIESLNFHRKGICEEFILPNLKINHSELDEPLPDDVLVIHIRSGDIYTHWPSAHPQNPFAYYVKLFNMYQGKVIFLVEDLRNPIVDYFSKITTDTRVCSIEDSYSLLLRARNIASSGVGSFVMGAALCSKNIKKFYCTDLWLADSLNPTMLKDHIEVYCAHLIGDKYIKIGEWHCSTETIDKILNYNEDILFGRL